MAVTAITETSLFEYVNGSQWAILALLSVLTLLASYYVRSFIGRAMYTMNNSLQRMLDDDLASRMHFMPVRDEFSTIARAVYKVADADKLG